MSGTTRLDDPATRVFVVGAGTMGAGIAQVAAAAGHGVRLFDAEETAVKRALRTIGKNLEKAAVNGRLPAELIPEIQKRIEPVATLDAASDAGLVVEAIVESLPVKRELFQRLEAIVADDTVLASNTSSLSITALAKGMRRPGRVVGMHFFNPVPQMKLVEVVSGLHTLAGTAEAISVLAQRWGKVPVLVRSTPGFIVNRLARPFYGEALALLRERAAEPGVIDRCVRDAGFRMGPCALMDLIGHDVNFAATEGVFQATFGDQRYLPSALQRELVDAGWLGRKSGRGFFEYGEAAPPADAPPPPLLPGTAPPPATHAVVCGQGPLVERWCALLARAGRLFERREDAGFMGLVADGAELRLTDGRPAAAIAASESVAEVAVFDLSLAVLAGSEPASLAWTAAQSASETWQRLAPEWLAALGFRPERVADTAGLIVARTVAMLINEAADAVLEGVCNAEAADLAMKLAMNFPAGPFEWLKIWDAREVVELLDHLDSTYRGARYRVSPELRQRAFSCQIEGHARPMQS
jgi:3-hydroxybutyryl-CoA dehydrogenase